MNENNNQQNQNENSTQNTNYSGGNGFNPNGNQNPNNNYQANSSGYNPNKSYGQNYEPPRYDSQNVPPYQNPENMYHYGREQQYREGTENHQQNDDYKWDLNDYSKGNQDNPAKHKKKNKGLRVFLSMLAIVLGITVVGFAGYGIYAMVSFQRFDNEKTIEESHSPTEELPNISIKNKPQVNETTRADGKLTLTEIAQQVKPSVVGIQIYKMAGLGISGEGSGIIMTEDGYIITNAHVVDGAQGIKVIMDNDEVHSATLIGLDEQTDIAVIKVDAHNMPYANFGNSDETVVGEPIAAIGNPGGMELSGSMTHGIVSAINRTLKMENGYSMKYIQVDAAINPGNSGGALVNEYGQVIGINSVKITGVDYEGIGFAIPINEALIIAKDIMENGTVTGRAQLGIQGIQLDSVTASRYGFPMGISIQVIMPNSDLANKGIVPGDVITKLDGVEMSDFTVMREVLANHKPGDVVKMTVYRKNSVSGKGKYIDVMVKLVDSTVNSNVKK